MSERPIAFRVETSVPGSFGPGDTFIEFNGPVTYDTHGSHIAGSSGGFFAPEPGFYIFTVLAYMGTFNDTFRKSVKYKINNGGTIYINQCAGTSGGGDGTDRTEGSFQVYLNAGDRVRIYGETNAGGAINFQGGTFMGMRVGRSSVIQPDELVVAKYKKNTSQVFGVGAFIQIPVKEIDTHGSVDISTDFKFTAPISGIYEIGSSFRVSPQAGNWSALDLVFIQIYKNGAEVTFNLIRFDVAAAYDKTHFYSTVLDLRAGDYIQFRLEPQSTPNPQISGNATCDYVVVKKLK